MPRVNPTSPLMEEWGHGGLTLSLPPRPEPRTIRVRLANWSQGPLVNFTLAGLVLARTKRVSIRRDN